jgi:hypothetical protein
MQKHPVRQPVRFIRHPVIMSISAGEICSNDLSGGSDKVSHNSGKKPGTTSHIKNVIPGLI